VTHGICHLSVIPLRSEPAHASEMSSQLLFGEHFEIIENNDKWIRIRMGADGYEGWLRKEQITPVSYAEFKLLNNELPCISYDLVQIVVVDTTMLSILLGSTLPHYKDHTCRLGDTAYRFEGTVKCPEKLQTTKTLLENAHMYIDTPYLWGGRTPFGIDCSGFTQIVFKLSGIKLKRDASQQAEQGTLIHMVDETVPGDLAFFDDADGKITHVGIVLGNNKIIHASEKVRIDAFDHHGIYNIETKTYSHNLRLIRRYV
jgi:gamma-D-glutamyl-L-lysine dipeptidyl-peptidase